jgi:LmbE family N-acetylglucosaminyl deacetylase
MPEIIRYMSKFLGRIASIRKGSGPYRFLVRRWKGISDIDLAIGVLDTQCFDRTLVPMPLPVEKMRSILVLAPHQDDETIGAGGTLLIAQKAGVKIHVLFITDGRTQKTPFYASSPEEVVQIRNREAAEVCKLLGANIHHLGLDNARLNPKIDDLDRLTRKIRQLDPQVLLVPWLLDTPKHRIVNHLLWLANRCSPIPDCEVWGYQVHNSLIPNGYVDITEVAEEKWKILKYYVSQLLHVRRYDHLAKGMAAWNCRFLPGYKADPVARYVEVFFALPLHEHLKLIESFYFRDLDATYRGMDVVEGMKRIHKIAVNRSN